MCRHTHIHTHTLAVKWHFLLVWTQTVSVCKTIQHPVHRVCCIHTPTQNTHTLILRLSFFVIHKQTHTLQPPCLVRRCTVVGAVNDQRDWTIHCHTKVWLVDRSTDRFMTSLQGTARDGVRFKNKERKIRCKILWWRREGIKKGKMSRQINYLKLPEVEGDKWQKEWKVFEESLFLQKRTCLY